MRKWEGISTDQLAAFGYRDVSVAAADTNCLLLGTRGFAPPAPETLVIELVAIGFVSRRIETVRQRDFACDAVLIHVTEMFILQSI